MFTVEDRGWRFRVSFRHDQVEVTLPMGERRMTDTTSCRLRAFRENGMVGFVSRVEVARHTTDAPNRKVARKYALAKLLQSFDKPFRQKIWQAYFDTISSQQRLAREQQVKNQNKE